MEDQRMTNYPSPEKVKYQRYLQTFDNWLVENCAGFVAGHVVLQLNICLNKDIDDDGVFHGEKFMDNVKKKNTKAYLFALGYFGSHDFKLQTYAS